jgi:hypothetical protein
VVAQVLGEARVSVANIGFWAMEYANPGGANAQERARRKAEARDKVVDVLYREFIHRDDSPDFAGVKLALRGKSLVATFRDGPKIIIPLDARATDVDYEHVRGTA